VLVDAGAESGLRAAGGNHPAGSGGTSLGKSTRNVKIIKVFGEVDPGASRALCDVLATLAEAKHACVVVDLSWVPFFDSTGLSALAAGYKRVKGEQRRNTRGRDRPERQDRLPTWCY
jgi:ABC-type transporter Mla MlaB component